MKGRESVPALSRAEVLAFGDITGNDHEMHRTDEAAVALGFPALVVQGPYLLARSIAASSEVLRGPGIALLGVTWRYTGAVMVDQPLELAWEVTGVRRTSSGERGIAEVSLNLECDGATVGSGGFTVLVTREFTDGYLAADTDSPDSPDSPDSARGT